MSTVSTPSPPRVQKPVAVWTVCTGDDPASGGAMQSWLGANGLTRGKVLALLSDVSRANGPLPAVPEDPTLPADDACQLVQTALKNRLPHLARVIDDIARHAPMDLDRPALAATIDRGAHALPAMRLAYAGDPRSVLTLTHEFGHAVQIAARPGRVMPPVAREVCAFLAERAVIDHAQAHAPALGAALQTAWEHDTHIYLGPDRDDLLTAVFEDPPHAPDAYPYRWNYPLARVLAQADWTPERHETLVTSAQDAALPLRLPGIPALRVAPTRSQHSQSATELPPGNLPALPDTAWQEACDDLHLFMGIAALLALNAGDQTGLGTAYAASAAFYARGTTALVADDAGRPVAYMTWHVEDNGTAFARLIAPFGHYDAAREALRKQLPQITRAYTCTAGPNPEVTQLW